MAVKKLIVGLGNPGREYEKTRHNLGFMALMRLAREYGAEFSKSRQADALTAEIQDGETRILLVLPLTFMNRSGLAVRAIAGFDKVDIENILVICDDIHLAFGDMRLRTEGTDGGHNGLKSIIAELGSESFPRLKIGVGVPPSKERQADYVLSNFSTPEVKELGGVIDRARECAQLWLAGNTARAMAEFNKRKDKKDNE